MPRFSECTREQLQEYGRRGGSKTKKDFKPTAKSMKDTLEVLLNMAIDTGKVCSIEQIQAFGKLQGKNVTVKDAVCIRLIQRALRGDLRAIEMMRDSIGEKPVDNLNIADITPTIISGEDDINE